MNDVKQAMIDQLHAKGLDREPFLSLVSDYMALYEVSRQLKECIKEDGAMIQETVPFAKKVIKKVNPALRELRNINAAMLKLLKSMNINAAAVLSDDAEDYIDEL